MSFLSKRVKGFKEKINFSNSYLVSDAVNILKETSTVKFDESVDISVNLGIDVKKSDQVVRGAVSLPNGSGKIVRVAVFADGEKAEEAKLAGADICGYEDLAESIKKGNIDFDVLIATTDAMRIIGPLGQILGPKGLMPNPKLGTVTNDVSAAIKDIKAGKASYRAEKGGIVHCSIGKLSFSPEHLEENLSSVLLALKKAKPSTAKGTYFKKMTISSTMGPGLVLDMSKLNI